MSLKWWKDTAFLAALLFTVHPIHVEAVSGIVGRADILAAITFFISIIFYSKAMTNQSLSFIYLFIVVLLSAISMLFKENGVTVLVSIPFSLHKYSSRFLSTADMLLTHQ